MGGSGFGGTPFCTLGCSESGDEGGNGRLQELHCGGETNDVWICEQVIEERLHVVQGFRAAQVQQQHPHLLRNLQLVGIVSTPWSPIT